MGTFLQHCTQWTTSRAIPLGYVHLVSSPTLLALEQTSHLVTCWVEHGAILAQSYVPTLCHVTPEQRQPYGFVSV